MDTPSSPVFKIVSVSGESKISALADDKNSRKQGFIY
jgi:hypothetical protein